MHDFIKLYLDSYVNDLIVMINYYTQEIVFSRTFWFIFPEEKLFEKKSLVLTCVV